MTPCCSRSSTVNNQRDESICQDDTEPRMKVRSVSEFVKTPMPDIFGHYPPLHPEPLHTKKPGIQRSVFPTASLAQLILDFTFSFLFESFM